MERLNNVLEECYKLTKKHLWLAIQTNTLNDVGTGFPTNWAESVGIFKNNLKEVGYYFPQLNSNYRNSEQIVKLGKDIQSNFSDYDVNRVLNVAESAAMLHNNMTRTIPYNFKYKDERFNQVIEHAFTLIRNDIRNNPKKSCIVILNDDPLSTSEEIFNALPNDVKHNEVVTMYPIKEGMLNDGGNNDDDDDDEIVNKLLTSNCLITPGDYFKGAEAENVIVNSNASGGFGAGFSSQRCSLLRAVSRLVIVQRMDESEAFTFQNTTLDTTCLKCLKECKDYLYKCNDCTETFNKTKLKEQERNEKSSLQIPAQETKSLSSSPKDFLICLSCTLKCHKGHSFDGINIKRDLNGLITKCSCYMCMLQNEDC